MALDISDLTNSLSNWEFAGYVSVAAVFFGVTGESLHEFTRCFYSFGWWKEQGGKASALLLIAALAAELLTQIKVNNLSGRVIAVLEDGTEQLRAANLVLEKKLAPRRITEDQQKHLARSLTWFARKTVRFESYALDAEAAILGKQIESALEAASIWTDESLTTKISGASVAQGVFITGKDSELVSSLRAALDEAGIKTSSDNPNSDVEVFLAPHAAMVPADAVVFIGVKPISE